jgi:NAD(P)-dependent dehydrogenase (short-subunit alcohol dehydrogenase family)
VNQIDLAGRRAVVTGGAQGIGYAISERFLRSGAAVTLWDIDTGKLDAAAASLSKLGKCEGRVVELTDDTSVSQAAAALPSIDILVNNAGITGGNGKTWELEPAMWRRVMEVNLIAPYLTCRHVVPKMRDRKYGRIVNIASVAGKEGNPNASHYSASKAGLIALTKSLAKEVATEGILVNAIAPAVAKTAIFEQMNPSQVEYMLAKIPMGRLLEVQEIAAMAAWLASEDCSFSTGAVFDITGGRSTY